MTKQEYNGWYNYETWVTNLWLDNDQGIQAMLHDAISDIISSHTNGPDRKLALEDYLKTLVEGDDMMADHVRQTMLEPSIYADLLGAAFSEINYYEIAEHLLDNWED